MKRVLTATFVLVSLAACAEGPVAEAPKRAMSAYQGHATELLDDAIEPRAVGLELEGVRQSSRDPILRARTEASVTSRGPVRPTAKCIFIFRRTPKKSWRPSSTRPLFQS